MRDAALLAAQDSLDLWAASVPWHELPGALLEHRMSCDGETCPRVEPRFPAFVLRAICSGDRILMGTGIWWPGSIRGGTRHLKLAMGDALRVAERLGFTIRVDAAPPTTWRDIVVDRLVRLSVGPDEAIKRDDVKTVLSRVVGAMGLVLSGVQEFSELGMTSAGLVALAGLDALGVPIAWDALVWDAITASRVTVEEVRTSRTRVLEGAVAMREAVGLIRRRDQGQERS